MLSAPIRRLLNIGFFSRGFSSFLFHSSFFCLFHPGDDDHDDNHDHDHDDDDDDDDYDDYDEYSHSILARM